MSNSREGGGEKSLKFKFNEPIRVESDTPFGQCHVVFPSISDMRDEIDELCMGMPMGLGGGNAVQSAIKFTRENAIDIDIDGIDTSKDGWAKSIPANVAQACGQLFRQAFVAFDRGDMPEGALGEAGKNG